MRYRDLKQASTDPEPDRRGADEPPPFGSWSALYALVIAGLLVMIAVCAAITRWAS